MQLLDWTEGKTSNLRALLTSLHSVLWPEAKWAQCYMHQLVTSADVKKAYRKACIAVHPDKVSSDLELFLTIRLIYFCLMQN